jgi:hypothetical protein
VSNPLARWRASTEVKQISFIASSKTVNYTKNRRRRAQILKQETKERITQLWLLAMSGATTVIIACTAIAWIIGLVLYAFRLIRRIYG